MPRPRITNKTQLTVDQERFVRMEANGIPTLEIIKAIFGLEPDDPEYHSAECKLSRWRKHPKYEECWKDEIRKQCFPLMSKAMRKLNQQVESEEGWLSNKASNDIINIAKQRIFGNEDNTVNVQVTGMPDLGSPDQPE
jgi:hypothetical protein